MNDTKRRNDALSLFIASAPLSSAALFLAAMAVGVIALAALFSDPDMLGRQIRNPQAAVQWIGAGVTAIAAIVASFRIHARGRTLPWRAAPLALFAAWQILTVYGCRDVPLHKPAEQILYGQSPECFLFILAGSIPIAVLQFWILRRHRVPVNSSAAALAGLGAAAISICLMQFFHPFHMNFGDWSIHFAAIGIVVGSAVYARQLLPSA